MTYASPDDVAVELEVGAFSAPRQARVAALLGNASLLVDQVPGVTARITSGALDPGIVKMVVVAMVARALQPGGSVQSETIGPKSVVYRNVDAGLYLTEAELALLVAGDAGGPASAGSVQLGRPNWWRGP